MNYSQTLGLLEEMISIPNYTVLGNVGGKLAYLSTLGGEVSIWALSGGKPQKLAHGSIFMAAQPKRDTDYIVFSRDAAKGRELHSLHSVNLRGEEIEIVNTGMRVFSLAYDKKRAVYIAYSKDSSSLYSAENGRVEKLTDISPYSSVEDVDGDDVVGSGMFRGNPKSQEMFHYNLNSRKMEIKTPKEGSTNHPITINDGHLYFTSDFESNGEQSLLYRMELETGEYNRIQFNGQDANSYNPTEITMYDPESTVLVGRKDGETKIFRDGEELKTPRGTTMGIAVLGRDVYLDHSSLVSPHRILKVDGIGNVTTVIDNVDPKLGTAEYHKLKTDLDVPAWVVKSSSDKISDTAVVYVHGGPASEVGNQWELLISPLLKAGYNVIAPNYRGSTGYGTKYIQRNILDVGGGDYRDVMAARDYAINNLGKKVCIMGYSYGGFMAFYAVGKDPEKWDSAIAGAGITDWNQMYGMSDSFFKSFMDSLFDGKRDLMKERSPASYVDRVKSDLCIIHGQNDSRTPFLPVLNYVQKLTERGTKLEMHVVPDIGHAIYNLRDAVDLTFPALLFLGRKEGT